MKKGWTIAIVVFALGIGVFGITRYLVPSTLPRLFVSMEGYDFGRVEEGEKIITEFYLKNNGGGSLEITTAKPSCSCSKVELTTHTISPGRKIQVKVIINTTGKKDRFAEMIFIYSNDPVNPVKRIRIWGMIDGKQVKS